MKTEHGYQLAMHLLEQAFAAYKDGKDEFEPGPFGYEHRTAMDELTADKKDPSQDEVELEHIQGISEAASSRKDPDEAAPEEPAVAAHRAPSSAAAKKAARRS